MNIFENELYYVEQFLLEEGHYDELSKLISISFLHDDDARKNGASLLFTRQTFNIVFGAPSVNPQLFVRAIEKKSKETVGFMGMIPRDLHYKNAVYKFAIPAWACVHYKHQRKGIAKLMGLKVLEIAKKEGYQGGFAIHEPVQHGIDTSKAVAREAEIKLNRMIEIEKFVIRVFDTKQLASVVRLKWYEKLFFHLIQRIKGKEEKLLHVRESEEKDIDRMFELTKDHIKENDVSIVQNYADFKWLIKQPGVIRVVHENEGEINGFLIAWEFNLAGFGNSIPFGWLDMIHTYNLTDQETKNLANLLCLIAKKKGWQGLQTPYIPYFKTEGFKSARFIFFAKRMTLDLFNLDEVELPEKPKKVYFDWR